MAQNNPCINFTGSIPLALNAQHPLPIAALKNIPYFTGENHTTPGDHVKNIANLCAIHEINEMQVVVKLLASSFKGKALQWFRSLGTSSITNWNQLCIALHEQFGEKGDNLSLLEQLTTIKRAPNEQLTDFNFSFQRSWDRIPVAVRITAEGAFLYYLKALNSDISMLIQSMGGTTLPAAYSIAIRAENCLIQAGKLAPRPPMPLYPNLENPCTSQAPTLAPVPTPRNQSSSETSTSSSSASNELQEVMKQLQNLGNELVSIKRQQAQGFRPSYQPQAQPNRQSYQPQRPPNPAANMNQNQSQVRPPANRPFQPYNPNAISASKALVPTQNNIVQEYDWCFPCNEPHNQSMCFNGALNQTLMMKTTGVEGEGSQGNSQQPETSQQQSAPNDTTLVNWQAEDFCGMNQVVSQGVIANTRSKRRNLGEEQPLALANPQPSMAPQMIGKQSLVSNTQGQPRTSLRPTQMPAVTAHVQGVNVQTKGQKKDTSSPFSIIEQMKKTNINISMWESLSIPGQRDLLQATMKDWSTSNQQVQMQEKILTNAAQPKGNHGRQQGKMLNPPPFYVSLIIRDKLGHNCMIDSGASSSMMPKKIADQLGL
ncbi:hypothetical protein KI387_044102 [Taxus chinensis]|uniref:Ty3 transposon capsid-like protein domain-containing protein n=1 Tax=Taxus chinensis TaxID=29808 RepID=A0AA38CNP3_TAXCH|nr:hypothetical protein KI387_044102 [Taxus chinensis]